MVSIQSIAVKPEYNGPLLAATVQPTYNYLLFVSFHTTWLQVIEL